MILNLKKAASYSHQARKSFQSGVRFKSDASKLKQQKLHKAAYKRNGSKVPKPQKLIEDVETLKESAGFQKETIKKLTNLLKESVQAHKEAAKSQSNDRLAWFTLGSGIFQALGIFGAGILAFRSNANDQELRRGLANAAKQDLQLAEQNEQANRKIKALGEEIEFREQTLSMYRSENAKLKVENAQLKSKESYNGGWGLYSFFNSTTPNTNRVFAEQKPKFIY